MMICSWPSMTNYKLTAKGFDRKFESLFRLDMVTPIQALKSGFIGIFLLFLLFASPGCSEVVYRPHSAKQKYFARPHLQFLDLVASYRETHGFWPASLVILKNTSPGNDKIIDDFQYAWVEFKIKSDDKMTMYFSQYKKEPYISNNDKIDLNVFNGRVNFFKSNGKFAWKVKMQ